LLLLPAMSAASSSPPLLADTASSAPPPLAEPASSVPPPSPNWPSPSSLSSGSSGAAPSGQLDRAQLEALLTRLTAESAALSTQVMLKGTDMAVVRFALRQLGAADMRTTLGLGPQQAADSQPSDGEAGEPEAVGPGQAEAATGLRAPVPPPPPVRRKRERETGVPFAPPGSCVPCHYKNGGDHRRSGKAHTWGGDCLKRRAPPRAPKAVAAEAAEAAATAAAAAGEPPQG
jgi:hypothetical protein